MQNEEIIQLHLDDVIPNRFQPREVFDDQALKELAVSIKEHGVIQPIIVRKIGEKYEIIAGERRYKASSLVGKTTIPAIVKNFDDKESSKVALIENLQRRDLSPIEEARTYQKILDIDDLTQEQLAKTMGKSQSSVANKLRLLSLPEEIQQALLKEQISERHARSLINLSDRSKQLTLLEEIVEKRLPVREVDERIKRMNEESNLINTNIAEVNTPSFEAQINSQVQAPAEVVSPTPAPLETFINPAPTFIQPVDTPVVQAESQQVETLDVSPVAVDQTIVDIDKIRSEAADINQGGLKQVADMSSLLKAEAPSEEEVAMQNRFIPDLGTPSPEPVNGQEIIGKGLLAGMPVIQQTPQLVDIQPVNQNGLSGIIEQENASIAPVAPIEPLTFVTPEPAPQIVQVEPQVEAVQAPVQEAATPASGADFTASEEIKFANIAIGNITRELESKGFKVELVNTVNNGVMEIVVRIAK